MPKTYYPQNDQAYDAWLANFVTQLIANVAVFGMVAADVDALADAHSTFDGNLTSHKSAQLAARAATAQKTDSRQVSEDLLKPIVRRINNHPNMTNALRAILGLVPQTIVESAVPIETLQPLVYLEAGGGQVDVHWGPSPQNEQVNGRPEGVKSGLIYRKKLGEEVFQLIGYATKSPYIDYVTGSAADYMYAVRYRGSDPKDVSKLSEPAMVAASGEQLAA